LDGSEPSLDQRHQMCGRVGLVGDGENDRALGVLVREMGDDLPGHEADVLRGGHVHAHPKTHAVARAVGTDRHERVHRSEAEQDGEGVDQVGDVVGGEDRAVIRHSATIVIRTTQRQAAAAPCGGPPHRASCGCRPQ
jgi:hypothetical protein